jgi:hypothetical protein
MAKELHSELGAGVRTAAGYTVEMAVTDWLAGVLVMFLAGLLAKRTATAPPQPAAQPA